MCSFALFFIAKVILYHLSRKIKLQIFFRKEEFDGINWYLFKTISLIYHGLTLFLLSLLNISLAAIVAAFTVPVYTVIRPTSYKWVFQYSPSLSNTSLSLTTYTKFYSPKLRVVFSWGKNFIYSLQHIGV